MDSTQLATAASLFAFFVAVPKLLKATHNCECCKKKCLTNGSLFRALNLNPEEVKLTAEEEAIGEVARRAAWAAGELVRAGKSKKDGLEAIRSTILSFFPDHKVLAGEDLAPGPAAAAAALEARLALPSLWIVNPLDGSADYAQGVPAAGVSIAYVSKGKVQHGFIFDPFRKESFAAWRGKGAFLDGRRLRPCAAAALDQAVVCTGSPPSLEALDACLRGQQALSAQVRSMRVLGSAGIHLCWVACGRISAYFEPDLNAWDSAAGVLLVREAGGAVSDAWGNDFDLSTRSCVASNGKIHDALLRKLRVAKMWI